MFPGTFPTPRLLLRPIAPDDAAAIFDAYAQDPEVTRYLVWRPHQRLADTQAYIAHCLTAQTSRTYVLTGRQDKVIRGAIDIRQPTPHRLEFGYVLARPHWGRGLMTETLQAIVHWALAQPAIFRIGAVCDIDNIASARVMEKAGLTHEGLLRRWMIHPNISDEPRDCLAYGAAR
jgi:ribosomal-protein-alanine N-acetyltransferase